MVFEIGVNLRVTECLDKGDRNYMEDFSKCYFERVDGSIVFGFFGIFDGHGGSEAANFAKKMLVSEIKKISLFWSENDEEVLRGIKQGFFNTHQLMWNEREKWAKTVSGFDSTAGTTATIAIVRNRKLYIGHVGDSACVLGFSKIAVARTDLWDPQCLTIEHKPGNLNERRRIEQCGGSLAKKSGVQRVVWNRPRLSSVNSTITTAASSLATPVNPVEGDSVEYEQVPFLAVTRSLGDLWSYDKVSGVYHISPEPDVQCIPLDSLEHRCIVLGSDGLWNVVSIKAAIEIVRICERETERRVFLDPNINSNFFYNPAASLVKYAISQWKRRHIRADNVSALVVMIDPPGPSMTKRREDRRKSNFSEMDLFNSLTCKSANYENFSKVLSKEFLIECSRWRSANESKDNEPQGGDKPAVSIQSCSRTETKDMECEAATVSLSLVSRRSSERSKLHPPTPITARRVSAAANSSLSFPASFSSGIGHVGDVYSQTAITSDVHYSKFCVSWLNNTRVWNFLADFFYANSLNSESEIIDYLNQLNSSLAGEILRLMPWIYTAKVSFRRSHQIYNSLDAVPIFSNFWVELYSKYIKPLERSCASLQFNNMQAIIGILKHNIIALLKQHNFLLNQTLHDKTLSGVTNSHLHFAQQPQQLQQQELNESNEILSMLKIKKFSVNESSKHFRRQKKTNVEQVLFDSKPTYGASLTQRLNGGLTRINRFVQSDSKNIRPVGGGGVHMTGKRDSSLKRSVSEKIIENLSLPESSKLALTSLIQAKRYTPTMTPTGVSVISGSNANHSCQLEPTSEHIAVRLTQMNCNFRQSRRRFPAATGPAASSKLTKNSVTSNHSLVLSAPSHKNQCNSYSDSLGISSTCLVRNKTATGAAGQHYFRSSTKRHRHSLMKFLLRRTLTNHPTS